MATRHRIICVLLCVGLLLSLLPAQAQEIEYPISEDTVRFLGRGEWKQDARSLNWPLAGIEFQFSGTAAWVYVSEMTGTVYWNVSVDGSDTCFRFGISAPGWYTLAEGLSNEAHTVLFSRSSEFSDGSALVQKLKVAGSAPVPTQPKARRMEFIGDSYTVGYANLQNMAPGAYKNAQNTDAWQSYAGIAARALHADANVIAWSGKGVEKNYFEPGYPFDMGGTMAKQFWSADPIPVGDRPTSKWEFSDYMPQVVVSFLGTNDYNSVLPAGSAPDEFYRAYYQFLCEVRAVYPSAVIIVCTKPSYCYLEQVQDIVAALGGAECGFEYLNFTAFGASAVDNHPNVSEHAAMGEQLVQKVNSISDVWEDKPEFQTVTAPDAAGYVPSRTLGSYSVVAGTDAPCLLTTVANSSALERIFTAVTFQMENGVITACEMSPALKVPAQNSVRVPAVFLKNANVICSVFLFEQRVSKKN